MDGYDQRFPLPVVSVEDQERDVSGFDEMSLQGYLMLKHDPLSSKEDFPVAALFGSIPVGNCVVKER